MLKDNISKKTNSLKKNILTILLFVVTFIFLSAAGGYFTLLTALKGSSPEAAKVIAVKMTSSGYRNIVKLYYTDEEINNLINNK